MSETVIRDCHTHNMLSADGIISVEPSQYGLITPGRFYSMGIHPWRAGRATRHDWEILGEALNNPNVLMVGECGLDGLSGVDEVVQEEVFRRQIELSETNGKPLIIHCVKRFPKLISLKKEYGPRQAWIIHGFRGKPQLASELIHHGFYLSVGEKFNKQSLEVIPRNKLLIETDESGESINDIESIVGTHLDICQLLSKIPASPDK